MPTNEEMQAELERLRAENEALKQNRRGGSTSMKVSEKGLRARPLPSDAVPGTMAEAAGDGR